MKSVFRRMSRRDFLLRSALFTVGACAGTTLVVKPFARALDRLAAQEPGPRIGMILDDVGFNIRRVEPFLDLAIPITYSILPHMDFSCSLAEKIHGRGHEVMLHQPMEPHNSALNPGPGALYLKQGAPEMERILRENFDNFPHAAGFNNHMGSRFTENRLKMQTALSFFLQREFYFVDSFTSRQSAGFATARAMNMTAAHSHTFIDNTRTRAAVYAQLVRIKAHALKNGCAIGIGHPWPETAEGLRQFLQELQGSNFQLVYASQIACV